MITPEKTYSTNPFVDNIIYYAKLMALNCTIKDEEEALANETKESLYAADVLIACVEKKSNYEMFTNIPAEILEKYIASTSNLDLYIKTPDALKAHLNSYSKYEKNKIFNRLSSLARTVYIDHYDIMSHYIEDAGPTWLEDNSELYEKCKSGIADYKDLFEHLPLQTVLRILKKYLSSDNYVKLSEKWDSNHLISIDDLLAIVPRDASELLPTYEELLNRTEDQNQKSLILNTNYVLDNLSSFEFGSDPSIASGYLPELEQVINQRTDDEILNELARISKAMREVFIDHYEIMEQRRYFEEVVNPEDPDWMHFYYDKDVYDWCIQDTATYNQMYDNFARDVLEEVLKSVLGEDDVEEYNLIYGEDILEAYFRDVCEDAANKIDILTSKMRKIYISNYNTFLSSDVYYRCKEELVDYYDLVDYIPKETLKSILNTEFDETTNIQVYSKDKRMLNSYLNTLDKDAATEIKQAINLDMQNWYPNNHVEKNNYYRALIGLPPMDSKGNVYEDTLIHSYDPNTESFIEFGETYINKAPTNIYPKYHWRQEFYKYDAYDVSILEEYDLINEFIAACGGNIHQPRYRYLKYLGDEKLNLYECRKAGNFELIGMTTVDDQIIKGKFSDIFNVNRDYVIRAVYSDAYKFQSDYYNKFIIIFILINTIMDMLTGIPDLIINRDVFDARCIKYLFESFGIPYYGEIPIKYQQAMLKNLNILIKFKSSTKNMVDICSLFGFRDVKVFGYYLMKDRNTDDYTGEFILDENNDINYEPEYLYVLDPSDGSIIDKSSRRFTKLSEYRNFVEDYYYKTVKVEESDGSIVSKRIINNDRELFVYDEEYNEMIPLKDSTYFTHVKADTHPASLKFIKVPIKEELSGYKKDTDYMLNYDEVTNGDQFWDGGLDHEYLKRKILDYEFNAVRSKYISIETATDMTDLSFQMSYFYNMIFDNYYLEDALTLNIPYIKSSHKFKFNDVICYLFALMYYYYGLEDNIMYSPTQILYVKGYNFNKDLNTILQDATIFTQTDGYGELLDYEKKNIFDINERISEDNYDYRKTFDVPEYYVKAFNMEADVDALDKWLSDNYQMSLEDFIVDDTLTNFNEIITVKSFYSLNNSYYQKSIFNGNMNPLQYNNDIKYAYDFELINKLYLNDVSLNPHVYIEEQVESAESIGMSYGYIEGIFAIIPKYTSVPSSKELMERAEFINSKEDLYDDNYILENIFGFNDEITEHVKEKIGYKYLVEVIDSTDNLIYILNNKTCALQPDGTAVAIYNKFVRYNDSYTRSSIQYYILNLDKEYVPLINGSIRIKNSNGLFIFGSDHVYQRLNGEFVEITDGKYFTPEAGAKYSILNFNEEYYNITDDGKYILNPDNCYIKVEQNSVIKYVLLKNISDYNNLIVTDSDCYIRDSDGHFIRFDYTDYYIRTHNDEERSVEALYNEEPLYVITNEETEYYDPEEPDVFYKKIEDFYSENNYTVYRDILYVKDSSGNYIPEENLVSPLNCYCYDSNTNSYKLVIRSFYSYSDYDNPKDVRYVLIRQSNNDYIKYENKSYAYSEIISNSKQYVYNSDKSYLTLLYKEPKYKNTKSLIVVFNKAMNTNTIADLMAENDKYNPSLHDNVWDENDWYYEGVGHDPNNPSGMHGENLWYYVKPGETREIVNENAQIIDIIGSGYYLDSDQYIGSNVMIEGEEYYISFDFETNFDGTVNISCTADSNVKTTSDRSYYIRTGEKKHVSQVFKANKTQRPAFRVLKYGFTENPINIGDYVVISNVRILKSYSDSFVSLDIPSYDQLDYIYRTNEAIYKWLISQMNNTDDKVSYDIYKKLYDSLMIAKYNKEVFKLDDNTYAKTYADFLKYRDDVLYDRLDNFKSMEFGAMQSAIADEIIEITYALNDVIGKYDYDYLYSYFPGASINFIQDYIYKIINWFKSWKVQLLGINTVYRLGGVMGDGTEGSGTTFDNSDFWIKILQNDEYRIKLREKYPEGFIYGECKINPFDATSPDGTPYTDKYDLDPSHRFKNKVRIMDRVRIIARTGNSIEFRDGLYNMHIVLNDDTTTVTVTEDNLLTISTINGDQFSTINENNMIISTDETEDDMFISQYIDEINLLSGDYIEYDELEDDDE